MATYKSIHTGAQVDTAVTKVLNDDCKVKYGNLIGNLEDQEDLKQAIDDAVLSSGDSSEVENKKINVKTDVLGYNTGAPSYDEKLIGTIKAQEHTTFDTEKFTLHGDAWVDTNRYAGGYPEQGRIGGFDDHSYASIKLDLGGNSIRIKMAIFMWGGLPGTLIDSEYVTFGIKENADIFLTIKNGIDTYEYTMRTEDLVDFGGKRYVEAYYNGGARLCTLTIYDENMNVIITATDDNADSLLIPYGLTELKIGGPTNHFQGDISGKGFCIDVDDIPVFMSDIMGTDIYDGPFFDLYTELYAYTANDGYIWADSDSNPTQLFDDYGRTYNGEDWAIENGDVIWTADQTVATYDSSQNKNYIQEAIIPVASGPVMGYDMVARGFSASQYLTSFGFQIGSDVELSLVFRFNDVSVQQDIIKCDTYHVQLENGYLKFSVSDDTNSVTLVSGTQLNASTVYNLYFWQFRDGSQIGFVLRDDNTGEELDRVEQENVGVGPYENFQTMIVGGPDYPLKGWVNLNRFSFTNEQVNFGHTLTYAKTDAGFNLVYPFYEDSVSTYVDKTGKSALYCTVRKDGSVALPHGNLYGFLTKGDDAANRLDGMQYSIEVLQMQVEDLYGQIGEIGTALDAIIGEEET